MAGFWNLSGHQPHDLDGLPLVGAKAFFYAAGTTTPISVYQDYALTLLHSSPVVADGFGRFPSVFFNQAVVPFYRSRVLDADNALQFDYDNLPVIGPQVEVEDSGGTVDPNAIAKTGDVKPRFGTDTIAGWVRLNGRTFGSATSGATEHQGADSEALFLFLWPDANISVVSGKGASAAADWAANKQMTLPDMRGRAMFGLDTMGNAAAGRITGGIVIGASGGTQAETLATTQLPAHHHTGTTDAGDGIHGHQIRVAEGTQVDVDAAATGALVMSDHDQANKAAYSGTADDTAGHQIGGVGSDHLHDFTTADTGGALSHNNLPPYMLWTFYMKL